MTNAPKNLSTKTDALLREAQKLGKDLTQPLSQLAAKCQNLFDAAATVSDSWSGSCLGYHNELYYGNFEKPPLENAFSPEWGGLHGIPYGWNPHTPEEVKARIEEMAKDHFEAVDSETKGILKSVQDLQQEIVIELSAIHDYKGFEKEKELLGQIEKYAWEKPTRGEYIHANLPNLISRDSGAVIQGPHIPAHLYYQAEAYVSKLRCQAVGDFLRLSERLLRQVQAKLPTVQPAVQSNVAGAADLATFICKRFHLAAKQLQQRQRAKAPFEISDEYDVQDLLHALLRLHFDDVRPEEWTPSCAGKSSRMDFLLKQERIVIETKLTREKLGTAEVSDELIIDVAHYKEHPDCSMLVCLVYDPDGRIKNPRGFEVDIARLSSPDMREVCIITP